MKTTNNYYKPYVPLMIKGTLSQLLFIASVATEKYQIKYNPVFSDRDFNCIYFSKSLFDSDDIAMTLQHVVHKELTGEERTIVINIYNDEDRDAAFAQLESLLLSQK